MDIRDICEYIIDHISDNISANQIAEAFHYDKSYLMRKFKEYTGFTISEFINECRIYNSTNPLIYTDDSILKIALNNGFNSLEYYSEKFKDIIGSSPMRFRQVYSGLLEVAYNSSDVEELNYVKAALAELQDYQAYLYDIGSKCEKPKVKILKGNN